MKPIQGWMASCYTQCESPTSWGRTRFRWEMDTPETTPEKQPVEEESEASKADGFNAFRLSLFTFVFPEPFLYIIGIH